jgi:hypothetical protein
VHLALLMQEIVPGNSKSAEHRLIGCRGILGVAAYHTEL